MEITKGLNPAQVQAVQAADGPVLVLAGPGSGKTRVLTHRIAHLIGECRIRPYNILAVTFTNKAAREMIARLNQLIGEDASRLTIGTFHATCARILRREAAHLGLGSAFVIYDDDDQRRLITQVLSDLNLDTKTYQPSAVHNAISRAKNELITAATYRPPTYWHEAVARAFEEYEKRKAQSNALDFDDLLLKTAELFREHDDVREQYQRRYIHVLVDEFQDTNKAQYELVKSLVDVEGRRNIFCVGDEDQSIYSWRGADFRNVLRFRSDFPDAQVYLLEQNYRSTQTILDAARAVIARNAQRTEKKLWTKNQTGQPIHLFEAYDEREESEYVAGEIIRLVSKGECEYRACAVMFRTNAQSRVLEDAFMRHSLPYKLIGATRFYQRREIKDVLAYLRLVHNHDDDVSLARVINTPTRGIGEKTLAQLHDWAAMLGYSAGGALLYLAQDGDRAGAPFNGRANRLLTDFGALLNSLIAAKNDLELSDLLNLVLEKTGYLKSLRDGTEEGEERANNVRELLSVTQGYNGLPPQTALATFLEEAALVADVDELDASANAVTLLTLHSAKGLEYEMVFITGMEEGICPHSRSMDNPDAMEEERRLAYVGITRAKKQLYLIRTFRRTIFGNSDVREPSRFLLDIPRKLVDGNVAPGALERRRAAEPQQTLVRPKGRDLFAQRRAAVQQTIAQHDEVREKRPVRPAVEIGARPPHPVAAVVNYHPGESVTHPVFGKGTVIESHIMGNDEEVTVAFEGRGLKRLMASYAKLEKA